MIIVAEVLQTVVDMPLRLVDPIEEDMPHTNADHLKLEGEASRVLIKLKDKILDIWEGEVRENVPRAKKVPRPILIDTLPAFLINLAEALSQNHPRALATEATNVAQEHGGERARVTTYGPEQIIQEYDILRHVLEREVSAKVTLGARETSIIEKSFSQAIQEAITAYFLVYSHSREQFVAALTHDLRNPLTAAKMAADLLLLKLTKPIDNPEDMVRSVSRISDNLKRLDRMIQDLLDANLMGVGECLRLSLSPVDLYALIGSLIGNFSESDQHRIKVVGDESIHGVWDPEGLRRAVENLISNAFKYGEEGAPVTITLRSKNERALICVHNKGIPIPVEGRELLFAAYKRSESAKCSGKKGWGIGLALVRGIAEAHGGSIAVDSSIESGTTFTIDVPRDARPFQPAATDE